MMSQSNKMTFTWADGSNSLSLAATESNEATFAADVALAAAAANVQAGVAFVATKLQDIWMSCDQACTVKTNSSTTPGNTFDLAANVPFVWIKDGGVTNPFTVDVTTLYVTNTSATTPATFKARGLKQIT
jgi:hypothetical protein